MKRNHALEVYRGDKLVFHSDGKWLYPLFDLERALEASHGDADELIVHDKIVGRAAALLLIRLGVGEIRAGLMSELAADVLDHHAVIYGYRSLVPRIDCRTEELLVDVSDPDTAYEMIRERARRADP